jgi:hypothetical protein
MMRIVYQLNDRLWIVTPTDLLPIEAVAQKDVPSGVYYAIVPDEVLPTDYTFRDAWVLESVSPEVRIGVDLDKAKGIARRMIEADYGELAVQRSQAMDADIQARIDAKQAQLMALRNQVAAAETLDSLRSLLAQLGD